MARILRRPMTMGAAAAGVAVCALFLSAIRDPVLVIPAIVTASVFAAKAVWYWTGTPSLAMPQGRYDPLFERLPDAMLVVTPPEAGHLASVEQANPAACELFGRRHASLIGVPLRELLPLGSTLGRSLATPAGDGGRLATEQVLWSGSERKTVSVEFYPIVSARGERFVVVVKDLADKASAERAIGRRERQLTELTAMTRSINAVLQRDEILRRVATAAREIARAEVALVGTVGDGTLLMEEYVDTDGPHPLGVRLEPGQGVPGRVWLEGVPFMTNDAPREAPPCPSLDALFQPVNVLCAPILGHEGDCLGVLAVCDRTDGHPFGQEDLTAVFSLASSGATAMENARVLDQLVVARAELIEHRERLQQLAGELSRTEERERRRIAEELHDRIGQELAVLRMRLAQAAAVSDAMRGHPVYDEVMGLIEQTIADTRTLTFEVSPPMLYTLGLTPALEWLCEQLEHQHGLAIAVEAQLDAYRVSDDARGLLYVCVRELLMNVVKHASASSAEVHLVTDADTLRIVVRDDGVGYEPAPRGEGFGLFSIRERLAGIGGALEVARLAGGGTEATIEAPLLPDP